MKSVWNHFLTAVMLLTRLPVGAWCRYSSEAVSASIVYFPAVGALVGVIGALTLTLSSHSLPHSLAVLTSMLATILVTGAYHEDGLADATDGIFGGNSPSRRLEIMKDSRIGNYGAIALWFSFTAKFFILQDLLTSGVAATCYAMILSHALGRTSAVALLNLQPHVGSDPSRSQPYCRKLSSSQIWAAILPPTVSTLLIYQISGVPIIAANILVLFCLSMFFESRLGGITGDCLGATVQLSELTTLTVILTRV